MLKIYKIGGGIIDHTEELHQFLDRLASDNNQKILIHGGGRGANRLLQQLSIAPKMIEGRRITDQATLDVVTGLYAGNLNKQIVAYLQKVGANAMGLSGADANMIQAKRRASQQIDWGFVGDVVENGVNHSLIKSFLELGLMPVFCAITHDKNGQLFNTNADTIASQIAIAMSKHYEVELNFCFDKIGVLADIHDENSLIPKIDRNLYAQLKAEQKIFEGMIPKLDNAFSVIEQGVKQVNLVHAQNINSDIKTVIC
ncbi:acetylglutamate kinase [Vaginella massiliensis]|uniref:acetylglutamate kinase n=1 Tax=Vaginella massiliensis TaxID=1816680 RepID=UPI000837E637|nr:acetylglutamate kinase [Vaginella massiliensis]